MSLPPFTPLPPPNVPPLEGGVWEQRTLRFLEAVHTLLRARRATGVELWGAETAEAAKTTLGLENVDNTADADKPVSDAVQALFDALGSMSEAEAADYYTSAQTDTAITTAIGGLGDLAALDSITASLISDASANGQSLITAVNYAAMRALLDLEAGTDFYSKAATDTLLGAKLNASAVSAFALTLLDDANAGVFLTTLGVSTVGSNLFTAANPGVVRAQAGQAIETLNSDANSNLGPAVNAQFRTIETTTLTASRNRNLLNTAAVTGDIYEYRRTSADGFLRNIRNSSGVTLGAGVPVGVTARFLFDGTNWIDWGRSAT